MTCPCPSELQPETRTSSRMYGVLQALGPQMHSCLLQSNNKWAHAETGFNKQARLSLPLLPLVREWRAASRGPSHPEASPIPLDETTRMRQLRNGRALTIWGDRAED